MELCIQCSASIHRNIHKYLEKHLHFFINYDDCRLLWDRYAEHSTYQADHTNFFVSNINQINWVLRNFSSKNCNLQNTLKGPTLFINNADWKLLWDRCAHNSQKQTQRTNFLVSNIKNINCVLREFLVYVNCFITDV